MQFIKDWTVLKLNKHWTVLKIKLDLFAIKNEIWTFLQKLK